ncbi:MAG: hypothetical protein JWN95_3208 [Frankiales bacterium]|nr:hypothetical protein [Frankiales bacterium]
MVTGPLAELVPAPDGLPPAVDVVREPPSLPAADGVGEVVVDGLVDGLALEPGLVAASEDWVSEPATGLIP